MKPTAPPVLTGGVDLQQHRLGSSGAGVALLHRGPARGPLSAGALLAQEALSVLVERVREVRVIAAVHAQK